MIGIRFTVLLLAFCVCVLAVAPVYAAKEKADPQERPVRFRHRFPTHMTIEEAMQYEQRVADRAEFAPEAEEDQSFVPATGTGGLVPGEIKNYPIPPNAIYCGETTWDFQWHGGPQRSIEHAIDFIDGDRYIHVVWMCLKSYMLPDSSRNVHYNCYDWTIPGWTVSTDDWGGMPIVEYDERSGYAHVECNAAGNAVVFHHSAVVDAVSFSSVTQFAIPGMGIYDADLLPSLVGQENIYPRGAIGTEEIEESPQTTYEVYHVGAQDSGPGAGDPAYTAYWRCAYNTDLADYEWQGPVPMSQTMTISHEFAANYDRVIMAYAHARNYGVGRNQYDNDLVYFESTEAGADWIAEGGRDLDDVDAGVAWNVTSYVDSDPHRVYVDIAVMFDFYGWLHFLFTTPGYNDDAGMISVGPTVMQHWSEGSTPNANAQVSGGVPIGYVDGTDAFHSIAASAMWGANNPNRANDGSSGAWNRYISKMTLGLGDGSTICNDPDNNNTNEGYLYACYTLFGGKDFLDKEDASKSGYQNGNIYISMSNDNGFTWDRGRCLTTANGIFGSAPTRSPGCNCPTDSIGAPECDDPCRSEHWGSIAKIINDTLHVFYICDYDAGGIPHDEGHWAVNKAVYHPLIGGGNPCPIIAPILGVTMTADPNCEYHGDLAPGLDPIDLETLTINNYGNADLIYSIDINQLSGGPNNWILIDGGTSIASTTIPKGGEPEEYEIMMDADETPGKGMYQAEIEITHNDAAEVNPFVIPISFFVADSFVCGTGTVMTTPCVALNVSNVESWGREDGDGGMWYYNATDNDTLYNPISDASLVIVNKTATAASETNDTIAYRDIFTNVTAGNPGFRALEDLKLSYNAATNESLGVANQVTVDSLIGITVQYWFPQDPDSCEFVRMKFSIYSNTFSDPDLIIGAAADLDVGSTTLEDDDTRRTSNGDMGGWIPAYNLIYSHGTEVDTLIAYPDTVDVTTQYASGMTALTCEPVKRAVVQSNRDYVYPEGGYTDQYLFEEFDSVGVTIWVDLDAGGDADELDYVDDIHVLLGVKEVTLTEDAWEQDGMHILHIAMVTSTQAEEDVEVSEYMSPYEGYVEDLIEQTKKAWKKGFGWGGDFAVNAPLSEANPYPIEAGGSLYLNATGTHEDGIGGVCCGCDFSVVTVVPAPTTGEITLVDDGDCRAHLAVSSDIGPGGTYTVTVAVADMCGDQTDELTFDINVESCNCGALGDMNADGVAHPMDAVYVIKIAYQGLDCGVYPDGWNCPWALGDVDCNGSVDPLDALRMILFICKDQDVLCDRCSTGK